ncbi:MAG TPA: four helix bundle protein [Gemmatimonadaceae bacterium]|nr:four helix bundle protein [Gemmatimonadaceae bacterium]
MGDFKKLVVWQKAHALAMHTDRVAAGIRRAHHKALRNQMVRAAMSIPANIVEGSGQESSREFGRFLRYAINSASELEYHLIAARDSGALPDVDTEPVSFQLIEVRKMLHGLLRSVTPSHQLAPPVRKTPKQ